ncbi:MAG: NAD-dependent epimerase/dehydratase family protein [Proteobacteria bacterium]|nr:NAD-dependent epimerase/dehydratase family protein [Pseudomonadota bacterium]NOG59492.1 NAD-dependent epimerase/dehydratase family protein [Pseudomonadota bacterium]
MKALVTGGGGFLGGAIVKALLKRGDAVKTIQRNQYSWLNNLGVETLQGDLTRKDDINTAAKDCDVIFHVAAKAGVWGDYDDYYQANVVATNNVLETCRVNNVKYLVYTSTPSVVFDGNDEKGINESAPYVSDFFNAYQRTKTEAEQLVINANCDDLKTVSLRPHLIWGPEDPHLVPRIISRAKSGRLKLVGNKNNKVDSCYIDNAVLAHLRAADCLMSKGNCAGKAYFISNGEPISMSDLINKILIAADLPEVNKQIPETLAYLVGVILEKSYAWLKIKEEPIMTRFVARQLSTSHWFDLTAAKQDIDYEPAVSIDEGMKNLKKHIAAVNKNESQ